MAKAAVVGGGIAGLSAAYFLAREGFSVDLYEMEYPGYSASGKSAGILVTIFEEDLLRHVIETYEFYRGLPGSEGRIIEKPALWVVKNRECARRIMEIHGKLGLSPPRAGVGDLGVDFDLGGDHYAVIKTFIVDTGWIINSLYSTLTSMGVRIHESRVVRRGSSLYAEERRLEGPVIVAAGPWTPQLLPEISEATVIYRCQIASVEGPTPRMVIEDDSLGYYLVPVSRSRFNIGDGSNAVIDDPFDGFKPDPEDTYGVLEQYASRVPRAWESRIVQIWSAPCITTGDSLPLAAEIRDSVYALTGFNGAGISIAPSIARLLVEHIVAGKPLPSRYSSLDRVAEGVVEPYSIEC